MSKKSKIYKCPECGIENKNKSIIENCCTAQKLHKIRDFIDTNIKHSEPIVPEDRICQAYGYGKDGMLRQTKNTINRILAKTIVEEKVEE